MTMLIELQAAFPQVPIILNGQLNDLLVMMAQREHVSGIMLGRLASANPYALAKIHQRLYPKTPLLTRGEVVRSYLMRRHTAAAPLSMIYRPLLNMAHDLPHAKQWKKTLMVSAQQASRENLLALAETYDSLFSTSQAHD